MPRRSARRRCRARRARHPGPRRLHRGLRDLAEGLQRLAETPNDSGTDKSTALAKLSTLVGAILLARASDDPALSRDILDAAHQYLASRTADPPA